MEFKSIKDFYPSLKLVIHKTFKTNPFMKKAVSICSLYTLFVKGPIIKDISNYFIQKANYFI